MLPAYAGASTDVDGDSLPPLIWPKCGIRRPHTGEWIVLIHELRQLETWVRTEGIPRIIVGTSGVDPIPPHLDIAGGYAAHADARAEAKAMSAGEPHQLRIAAKRTARGPAGDFRQKLPEIPREAVDAFVADLSDTDAVEKIHRYMRVRESRGELHAIAFLRRQVPA